MVGSAHPTNCSLGYAVNVGISLTAMLKTVTIENFRAFESFRLQNLGRLNLLVGKNNSGKTSILEAIQLLCSPNDLEPLLDTMGSRGESFWNDQDQEHKLDVRHLFHDHKIQLNRQCTVSGEHENIQAEFRASIAVHDEDKESDLSFEDNHKSNFFDKKIDDFQTLDFRVESIFGGENKSWRCPLSINGGLSISYILKGIDIFKKSEPKTQFIASSGLSSAEMIDLFDEIVLTPEEDLVVQALQTIEPRIIRIATLSSERLKLPNAREGFLVRFSDSNQRIPIGSMGDGMWRILGLALATVGASNGVLLVDEIDTGLHFTAMSDMWKLVWETAKRLNVQVFATTHSSDCWMSLADIASREDTAEDGITIQRIEKGKETGVAFNREQILAAAKWDIEVR